MVNQLSNLMKCNGSSTILIAYNRYLHYCCWWRRLYIFFYYPPSSIVILHGASIVIYTIHLPIFTYRTYYQQFTMLSIIDIHVRRCAHTPLFLLFSLSFFNAYLLWSIHIFCHYIYNCQFRPTHEWHHHSFVNAWI